MAFSGSQKTALKAWGYSGQVSTFSAKTALQALAGDLASFIFNVYRTDSKNFNVYMTKALNINIFRRYDSDRER